MTPNTYTITLTSEEANSMLNDFNTTDFYSTTINKIRDQIRSSQNDLRLKVLKGEWEPKKVMRPGFFLGIYENFYVVNRKGEISHYKQVGQGNFIAHRECGGVFAPTPELAEELSLVIQGKHRPTQADIDAKVAFWRYSNIFRDANYQQGEPIGFDGAIMANDDILYFFTEAQRTAFIKNLPQPEEKKAQFAWVQGKLGFGLPPNGMQIYEMSASEKESKKYNLEALSMLNQMLAFCREKGAAF